MFVMISVHKLRTYNCVSADYLSKILEYFDSYITTNINDSIFKSFTALPCLLLCKLKLMRFLSLPIRINSFVDILLKGHASSISALFVTAFKNSNLIISIQNKLIQFKLSSAALVGECVKQAIFNNSFIIQENMFSEFVNRQLKINHLLIFYNIP